MVKASIRLLASWRKKQLIEVVNRLATEKKIKEAGKRDYKLWLSMLGGTFGSNSAATGCCHARTLWQLHKLHFDARGPDPATKETKAARDERAAGLIERAAGLIERA